MRLAVLHNLYFYNHLMEEIRGAIEDGNYHQWKEEMIDNMKEYDREAGRI